MKFFLPSKHIGNPSYFVTHKNRCPLVVKRVTTMPSFKKFILTIGSPIEGAPYTPKVSLTGLLVCCPYSADFVAFYTKKYRFSINYFPQLLGSQKQTQPIQTDQRPFSSGHRLAKHVNFILTVHQKMVCWCILGHNTKTIMSKDSNFPPCYLVTWIHHI